MWRWIIAGGAVAIAVILGTQWPAPRRAGTWQRLNSPGPLSNAHAFIGDNCAACLEPVAGVTRAKCVACHADDADLLQRQPTAFHASISECAACHYEHQPGVQRPIVMDHAALARIGLAELGKSGTAQRQLKSRLMEWMRSPPTSAASPRLSGEERVLNCVARHRVNDVHSGNFGDDCSRCHGTKNWFIAAYVHPSPSTRECAQCHRASPCHFMPGCLRMMGHMAGGEGARLEQCYRCHKTTSWYDFKNPMGGHHLGRTQ